MNQIQEEEFVVLSRQQANQLIPSQESAYYGLVLQGKYLPKCTFRHILCSLSRRNQYRCAPQTNQKIITNRQASESIINGQKWGIDLKHTPNKEWIVNVQKTLKPDHSVFKSQTEIGQYDMKKFSIEQINITDLQGDQIQEEQQH